MSETGVQCKRVSRRVQQQSRTNSSRLKYIHIQFRSMSQWDSNNNNNYIIKTCVLRLRVGWELQAGFKWASMSVFSAFFIEKFWMHVTNADSVPEGVRRRRRCEIARIFVLSFECFDNSTFTMTNQCHCEQSKCHSIGINSVWIE